MQNSKNAQPEGHSVPQSSETAQQILQVGEAAGQLLNSPVYQMAYRQLIDENYQEWLASTPKEERKRESLYHEARGLERITHKLTTAATEAQRILQEQQDKNNPEAQHKEYLNNQGFGLN